MKLGSVIKNDKKDKETLKKLNMTPCRKLLTSFPFSRFMTNFWKSWSWIADIWYVMLAFLMRVAFYLTKTGNRTEKSLTKPIIVKVLVSRENTDLLQKNADISKIKGILALKDIFTEIKYVFVFTKELWSL